MSALRNFVTAPRTIRVCQIAIGVLMAWAGLAKIGNLHGFAEQLHNFRMMPIPIENLIAISLPWIELVAALALIFGVRARAGAILSALLLVAFTTAVFVAMLRGLDIECGCFGTNDATRVGWVKIGQNLAMLALAAVGSIRSR
jgi:putative oxidoreductase